MTIHASGRVVPPIATTLTGFELDAGQVGFATPEVVASWIGVPERTVLLWEARGQLPSVRHPRSGRLFVDYRAAYRKMAESAAWWDSCRLQIIAHTED